jgi:hypothetical protein
MVIDFTPTSYRLTREELDLILHTKQRKKWFCWHSWIYWTFGMATKKHRVCEKCFKKQKNRSVVKESPYWHKETYFIKGT